MRSENLEGMRVLSAKEIELRLEAGTLGKNIWKESCMMQ